MYGVSISVSNTRNGDDKRECGAIRNQQRRTQFEIKCRGTLRGRYVTVTKRDNGLTLCEVKVMGRNIPQGEKEELQINYSKNCIGLKLFNNQIQFTQLERS